MIIDAYNNIWEASGDSDYLTAESYTAEDLIPFLDEAGVDMAVGCSLGQAIMTALSLAYSGQLSRP